jgi:glycosyltransferase involved in cell wall biosynthesis
MSSCPVDDVRSGIDWLNKESLHMPNKSVCIVVQSFYDTDPRVRRKAEALVSAGYHVDVIALLPDGRKEGCYELDGVKIYTIPIKKKRAAALRYVFEYCSFFVHASWRATALMRKHRYSVIDVNSIPDFLVYAALIPRWMGAKVVLDMHEFMPEFFMSKYGLSDRHILIRLLKWQERISFNFADQVVLIHEPMRDIFAARGLRPEKTTVVISSANETFLKKRLAEPVPAEKPEFLFMYHGTLTKLYAPDIAVRAFANAAERMPGAQFWLIGGGTERPLLKSLIAERGLEDRIRLIEPMPQDEIGRWLALSDVGVTLVREDLYMDLAIPNKLPECIVMGTPVLICELNTVKYYFSDKAVCYFKPGDEVDLADKMVELYSSKGRREALAAQALVEYEPIKWSIMRERYLNLISRLCE